MKLKIFLLALTTSFLSQAQTDNVFSLKPSFGVNGCQIHGDNAAGYDKFGLFLGTAIHARTGNKTGWELGFYLSQKGARKNIRPKLNDYTYFRIHLNYIDIPLSFRYQVNEKYFITMGPSVAYLVSYRESNETGDLTGDYPFNKIEAGLNIGLGAEFKERWTLELRCSNSLLPLRDYGIPSTVYYPNPVARFFNRGLYSNILSLFLTYNIDLRKNNG
jgi:hypothetical protein